MRNKGKFLGVLLICFIVILTACSTNSIEEPNKQSNTNPSPTVKAPEVTDNKEKSAMTMLINVTPEQLANYRKWVTRAESEINMKIDINTSTSDQITQKRQILIAAGENPEYFASGSNYTPFAASGALVPLDQYIKEHNVDMSRFDQNALQAMSWNGETWMIPQTINTVALYYNKDLFDQANIPYPSTDWNESWEWDQFLEYAKLLTIDKNGRNATDPNFDSKNIVQYGIADMQGFEFWPWYFGGSLADSEGKIFTGHHPEAIEGIKKVTDLSLVHHVTPTIAIKESLNNDLFATGQAAMTLGGNWALSSYMELDRFEWNVGVSPKGTNQSIVIFPDGIGIGNHSKNPDGMWKLIDWIINDSDNFREVSMASAGPAALPALLELRDTYLDVAEEYFPGLHTVVFSEALKHPDASPVTLRYNVNHNEARLAIKAGIDRILLGDGTVEAIMNEIQPEVQRLLDQEFRPQD